MIEAPYKTELKKKLKRMFPGCIVLHLNPNDIQGIPDLLVLYGPLWATLEGKRSSQERHRPNQDYYVDYMNNAMHSFSSFIYPENEQQVLEDLKKYFKGETGNDMERS